MVSKGERKRKKKRASFALAHCLYLLLLLPLGPFATYLHAFFVFLGRDLFHGARCEQYFKGPSQQLLTLLTLKSATDRDDGYVLGEKFVIEAQKY